MRLLLRPQDRIQFAKTVLPWGEARARECIRSDPRPSEQRSPRAKQPWPGGLRRFWLLASLLVGPRGVAAMLPPRASPETKIACNKLYSILRSEEYVVSFRNFKDKRFLSGIDSVEGTPHLTLPVGGARDKNQRAADGLLNGDSTKGGPWFTLALSERERAGVRVFAGTLLIRP